MAVIWYCHQLPIPMNADHLMAWIVPDDIVLLSLPFDSRLPIDVTSGFDFDMGFALTVEHGFILGSSSLAYPSVNNDSNFNS